MGHKPGDPYTPERREQNRKNRMERIERAKADPSLVPHGTNGGRSNWGCKCSLCMAAAAAHNKVYRRRKAEGLNGSRMAYNTPIVYVRSRPISV